MRYEVHAERHGRWWAIEIPAVPKIHSQARRLDQVKAMAADALTFWFEDERPRRLVTPDQIDVVVRPGPGLDRVFSKARKNVEAAERARRESAASVRAAVAAGRDAGLTARDIGELLGLSFQRAAVLLKEASSLKAA